MWGRLKKFSNSAYFYYDKYCVTYWSGNIADGAYLALMNVYVRIVLNIESCIFKRKMKEEFYKYTNTNLQIYKYKYKQIFKYINL